MCGIAGIISSQRGKFNPADIQKMTAALAHRGPDGQASFINPAASALLGHCRLAIIDPQPQSCQPMHFAGRYSIVHNGEIYNYIELRDQLQQKGYTFRTQSDTEVILAAYDAYNEHCLDHFDGMFAFAIWDETEQQLFAARDRFGEKPFYYAYDAAQGNFFFASELKALWAGGVPKIIDNNRLLNYIALGYTSHPSDKSRTFYRSAKNLPAAHWLKLTATSSRCQLQVHRYWELDRNIKSELNEAEAVEKFRALFYESVSKRLHADVPIGTSLSGGMDSSSVVAAIHAQQQLTAHYTQNAFTASFPGFEKDETDRAKKVARQFNLTHHLIVAEADDFARDIAALIRHHEEPISSASVYAQYRVFEKAKAEGVKVLLDGQGADEVLAGYSKYIHWYLQELLHDKKISAYRSQKQLLEKEKANFEWGIANYLAAFLPGVAAGKLKDRARTTLEDYKWVSKDFSSASRGNDDIYKPVIRTLNDILYYNTMQFGLEDLLRYADKNAMAHGRELRLPFLQHNLVQFIFSLPAVFKINKGYTKWLLREAMQHVLPPDIVWRTEKTAFEPPQLAWMNNDQVQEQIRESKQKLVNAGILIREVLDQKVQPHTAYAADNNDWRYLTAGILV
jgi:asparagine synthase (glutamine-hydrolysing)